MKTKKTDIFFTYLILILVSFYILVPFGWVFLASFHPKASVYISLPKSLTLSNFVRSFTEYNMSTLLANSIILSVTAMLVAVFVSLLAGYATSRFYFAWKSFFMYSILLLRIFPPTSLMLPVYIMARHLSLNDNLFGLGLIIGTLQIPLAIWIIKGFFDAVPHEIEEAALLDGCTRLRVIFRILLPIARPGIVIAGLFAFIAAWGNFLFPLILISSPEKMPFSLGLFNTYIIYHLVDWGALCAMSLLYTLPPAIFFLLGRKSLVKIMLG